MTRRLVARLSPLSLALALAASACSGGPGTSAPVPAAEAKATPTAETVKAPRHGPGHWFFRQVGALDLRPDQRESVAAIQAQLVTDMAPHRVAVRQALLRVADSVERGELDATTAAAQKASLGAALDQVKTAFATAINGVHDTLDAPQRVALVTQLAEQHAGHAQEGGEHPKHGLAKLAVVLGLTDPQRAALSDAIGKGLDELFPARKARREAWEAKMKAMGEAFVTDDFDAADYDLADHAEEAIAASVEIATRGVDVSNRVLSAGQRKLAADWMRERVGEM